MPWPWETLARPWRPGRSRAGLNGAVPSSARQNVSPGGKGDDEILPPPRTPVHLLPQDSGLRASTRQRPPARPAARAGADADERLKPVVPFS